jgi:hypothetical protein
MFFKPRQKNKVKPILESDFYHDGRGPTLENVIWKSSGASLIGFEFFNPDDGEGQGKLKYLTLTGVEAYSMSSDEVHGNILANGESKAAIFEVEKSSWLSSFNPRHLSGCKHFQIIFYDEIFDVICKGIKIGDGKLAKDLIIEHRA